MGDQRPPKIRELNSFPIMGRANAGYFYMDDGSLLNDGFGHMGVKALGTVPVQQGQDPVGKYVRVTGVSSCYKPGSDMFRLIRATDVVISAQ